MPVNYFPAEFEVLRNYDKCIQCRACERQCANEVHYYDGDFGKMLAHENQCVDCQRCVSICPTGALKIKPNENEFRKSANYTQQLMTEAYRQAGTGSVLLSSMGTPKDYPVYWDKILLNASQVTNPPIDPLREPMETRVFLGKKPTQMKFGKNGELDLSLEPSLSLKVPIMFSAMSYGWISKNAHESLARAAEELGTYYNTGEGGLHRDFYKYGANTIVQVASGRFGVHRDYLNAGEQPPEQELVPARPFMEYITDTNLGFTEEDAMARFGHLINAFKYGAPPHGGLAYGLDRLVMWIARTENIRDVIAFPKVQNASDLMMDCPSVVDEKQLRVLSIKVDLKKI